jgi:hypothetical protein
MLFNFINIKNVKKEFRDRSFPGYEIEKNIRKLGTIFIELNMRFSS